MRLLIHTSMRCLISTFILLITTSIGSCTTGGNVGGDRRDDAGEPRVDGGGGVIFSSSVETGTLRELFPDGDFFGAATISDEVARSGARSVRIAVSADEDGAFLSVPPFPPTGTLYARKYEYFMDGWAGNWPVGLKTGRYFTTANWTNDQPEGGYAYMSENLVWQGYDNEFADAEFGRGFNFAIYNLDLFGAYGNDLPFANGMPLITTGHWYKIETWLVLSSGVDIADGVLQFWVDDVLVYSNTSTVWKSSERGVPNGEGWQSMGFGGQYGGAIFGDPSETLYRYIDDMYVSTTLDR